ncbi:DgyrCDS12316 [Dimorphilus gyrociliatus]|uniref:DgyrCDS12316 n=1 Tax=Dimorphilus gyrociliatus TaxID=2664684 RepID=A0A7I8W7R9_9ANNE|nr:DgyrCDS12316 [Dimorphilus gyrociliatus]
MLSHSTNGSLPMIIEGLQDQSVALSENAKFKVSVQGNPKPSVQWFAPNGREIGASYKFMVYQVADYEVLEIVNTEETDRGVYRVKVTNTVGSVEAKANLDLYIKRSRRSRSQQAEQKPKFSSKLQDLTANDHEQNVELSCCVSGNPQPTITWYFGEQLLENSKDFKQVFEDGRATLIITEIYPDDDGTYICKAVNSAGEDSCLCKLTVKDNANEEAMKFVKPLSDIFGIDTESAQLCCQLENGDDAEIKWIKEDDTEFRVDGSAIKSEFDGKIARLIFEELFPEDDGLYSLYVRKGDAQINCSCKLSVKPKPLESCILRPLHDENIDEGSTCLLTVEIDPSCVEPEIRWMHNKKPISNSSPNLKCSSSGNVYNIEIHQVTHKCAGIYDFFVSAKNGNDQCSCKITVIEMIKKPDIITKSYSTSSKEGDSIELRCLVNSLNKCTVNWLKDDRIITNRNMDKRFKDLIEDNACLLRIDSAKASDSANYTCIVENSAGKSECSIMLNVHCADRRRSTDIDEVFESSRTERRISNSRGSLAEVKHPLHDVTLKEGDELTLECEFASTIPLKISWFCEDKRLEPTDEIFIDSDNGYSCLSIANITREFSGKVMAKATNGRTSIQTACIVKVEDVKISRKPPQIKKELKNQTVMEGKSVSFEVEFYSSKPVSAEWFSKGEQLDGPNDFEIDTSSNKATLKIIEALMDDAGQICVRLSNDYGKVQSTCNLTVRDREFTKRSSSKQSPRGSSQASEDSINYKDALVRHVEVQNTSATLSTPPRQTDFRNVLKKSSSFKQSPSPQPVTTTTTTKMDYLSVLKKKSNFDHLEKKTIASPPLQVDFREVLKKKSRTLSKSDDKEPLKEDDSGKKQIHNARFQLRKTASSENLLSNKTELSIPRTEAKSTAPDYKSLLKTNVGREDKPKILKELDDQSVTEGGTLYLKTTFSGIPSPSVIWKHEDLEIKQYTDDRIDIITDKVSSTLVCRQIQDKDHGKYLVKVRNQYGFKDSTCKVIVNKPKRMEELKPPFKNLDSGIAGSRESLDETEQFGDIQSKLRDRRRRTMNKKEREDESSFTKQEIDINQNINGTDNSSLESPPPVEKEPEPEPPVEEKPPERIQTVQNELLDDDSSIQILRDLKNAKVLSGDVLMLQLKFDSQHPITSVSWYKDNQVVKPKSKSVQMNFDNKQASLLISDVNREEEGEYCVEICNEIGEIAESSCFINVLDYSRFGSMSKAVSDRSSQDFSSISKPDTEDSTVLVEEFISSLEISNCTYNSVMLSWTKCENKENVNRLLRYRVEMNKLSEDKWVVACEMHRDTEYAIENLEEDTEYKFKVIPMKTRESVETARKREKISDIVRTLRRETVEESDYPFEPKEVEPRTSEKFADFYQMGEKINSGRFGDVHHCVDNETKLHLACKVIKKRGAAARQTVQHELNIMNELRHPRLLIAYDAFINRNECVLVMEFVAGGELFEKVVDEKVVREIDCIGYIRQICEGCQYMHEKSIVHLDLKPENIVCVSKEGTKIKIIDFGLAQKLNVTDDMNNRSLQGTAEFAAPEILNYDPISTTTDMWSVGVICYVLLSGIAPFAGETDDETITNVTSGEYDFTEEFDIISDLGKNFISKLLQKRPRRRMLAKDCLSDDWLTVGKDKLPNVPIDTTKLRSFMNRRKWQQCQ